jgi:predicted dehydrogenase
VKRETGFRTAKVLQTLNNRTLNAAVLGLGWWGSKVLRNFCENSSFSNVYAFDKDSERVRHALSQQRFQPLNSLGEVLENKDIHAVAVVTPPETHFELVRQALGHGKHVMVAKPPAQTVGEVEELCALAEKKGLVFMVDSTFVYNPATLTVRQLVRDGLFPNLRFVQSVRHGDDLRFHNLQRILDLIRISGTDVIEDLAFQSVRRIHILDPSLCDTAFMELDLQGIPVQLSYSWSLPDRRRQLLLYDDEKFLLFDDLKKEQKIEIYRLATKESEFPEYPQAEPLHEVVEHLYSCIAEGHEPLTGKQFMLDVMCTLEQIRQFDCHGGPSS